MRNEEHILRRILNLRSFFVINIFILTGIGLGLGKLYWNNYHLKREMVALEAQAREIETKNLDLIKIKKYFESPEFLEKEARLKLGFQKEGENTVIIEGANTKSTQIETTKLQTNYFDKPWLENPRKWLKHFFK